MVAVGPNVTVNTILSLPFIKQTKMIVNAEDQVAELCVLDALPFPIQFQRTQCHIPTIDETKVHVNMIQNHSYQKFVFQESRGPAHHHPSFPQQR